MEFLFVCEIWPVTVGQEQGRKFFENRMLRKIFEPKRYKAAGCWREFHKEDIHDLTS
jgi:hypothetical protein